MTNEQPEPLIRMHFHSDNPVLTVDQFDQLDRELMARAMLGDLGIGDTILWKLVENHRDRADECRVIVTTHSKRKALAKHLLLELDDRIFRHNDTDIYQAHEAQWRVTGNGPYEFELLKDS